MSKHWSEDVSAKAMLMKVYIAGSISNGGTLGEAAIRANMVPFKERANWLEVHGYEPLNPCENVSESGWTWQDWMRAGLRQLLSADAISLLPGWERSQGAQLEWDVARALNYPVVGP